MVGLLASISLVVGGDAVVSALLPAQTIAEPVVVGLIFSTIVLGLGRWLYRDHFSSGEITLHSG